MPLTLYSYWRSSAAYRVRIALNLKRVDYAQVAVDLAPGAARQQSPDYLAINVEGRVPALAVDGTVLTQSLAILEYLDERFPAPRLLPVQPLARAEARSLAQLVACDVSPLNNVSVLLYLKNELGADEAAVQAWYARWVRHGFTALEARLAGRAEPFAGGEAPGLVDCVLVPQVYNARRFACDLTPYPTLVRINQACLQLPAFDAARPERQADAPASAAGAD